MSNTMIAMLRDEYLAAQDEKKRRRGEIQDRHRDIIAEEIAVMEDAVDKRLGELLVRALESGMKRTEVWKPVFGTNDNKRWTRLVELGGGTVRTKRTGAEIRQEVEKSLGVKRVAENLFDLIVGKTIDGLGELAIPVEIQYKDGKPFIWPVDPSDVVVLRDEYGYSRGKMFDKGAEIVAAFGIEED